MPMRNTSSSLWPVHYKPLPGELLSCWLVRLAHGHGMKAQTFCNVIFGNRRQVWNRDIDRLAPTWLLDELSFRTGTPLAAVFGATLRAYEGLLYRKFRSAGPLNWILLLQMYHRKRNGYGLQFCPTCLYQDSIPYYRIQWRVALNTVCPLHGTMLLDRCPACAAAIAFHRLDIGKLRTDMDVLLSTCHACDFDLRSAPTVEPHSFDTPSAAILLQSSQALMLQSPAGEWDLDRYAVMHHLCRTMTTRYEHVSLRKFVLKCLGYPDILSTTRHMSFEMRPIEQRHHLAQLGAWMLVDLEARLVAAWRAQAVRYNVLLKDFPEPPIWYQKIVEKLSDWRGRLR